MTDYSKLDAWVDAHFDEEVRFLHWCACPPTPARRATMPRTPSAPPSCCGPSACRPRPTPCPKVRDYGLQSITNLIVRREYGPGRRVALNAHGEGLPRPYGAQIEDGNVRPRRRRRKSDFASFTFAVRALEAVAAPRHGAVELHFTYDEEFGGLLGPGWLLRQLD